MISCSTAPESYGADTLCNLDEFYFVVKRLSKVHENVVALNQRQQGKAEIVASKKNVTLKPGEKITVRFVRTVQDMAHPESELFADAKEAMNADLQRCVDDNETLFRNTPHTQFKTEKERWFTLAR